MQTIIEINDLNQSKFFEVWDDESIIITFNDQYLEDRDYDLNINLTWVNACVVVEWRVLVRNKNVKKYKIKLNFLGENQKWILNLKWIAEWNSKISFDWIWILNKNSKQADVKIHERIVLFSDKAIGQAIPTLRVETSDIKEAFHSAVIAPIEDDLLFYLASKWVSDSSAKKMISEWFLKI